MLCPQERLEKDFAELAQIGALADGGFSRIAFSAEDLAARSWLLERMVAADLEVTIDAVGNIRGRRAGTADLPAVMLGSHLDTVPEGGNYDGAVGVLAALEVVRMLNDRQLMTRRPIEVINFSAEESSRFGMATIGSKALTGQLDCETMHELVDQAGISLYQAISECGYHPEKLGQDILSANQVHAFLELHIEQGPVLENSRCPIGIVTDIAAPTRLKVIIEGRADHSGTTPMQVRKDALAGASEIVLGVEKIAAESASNNTVATVGTLQVVPGAMNVVPGRVELGIDLRDVNMQNKQSALTSVKKLLEDVAGQRGLEIHCQLLCHDQPVALSAKVADVLEASATAVGKPFMLLFSGAGHDAMNMASVADTGLIFIPSVAGLSHNKLESSRLEDICAGTEVLLAAVLKLAEEV